MLTRTVIFIPPLARQSGGLTQICRLAATLRDLGHDVAVTRPEGNGRKAAADTEKTGDLLPSSLSAGSTAIEHLPTLPWDGLRLTADDLWVIPESWPNALAPAVAAGASTLVYSQSWSYLLGLLPEGVGWRRLPARFLAVSRPVAWYLRAVLGVETAAVLPPVVDPAFQAAALPEPAEAPSRVRVAFMPRKNPALARQIRQIAQSRLSLAPDAPKVEFVAIDNRATEEVALIMASCRIFLCTAFPEGFGLPPLEAMAAGCVPVGFTGMGGWEYMRQAPDLLDSGLDAATRAALFPDGASLALAARAAPAGPLPGAADDDRAEETAPAGNGLFASDGDITGAGLALASAIRAAGENSPAWRAARAAGQRTARRYTLEAFRRRLADLWPVLLNASRSVG